MEDQDTKKLIKEARRIWADKKSGRDWSDWMKIADVLAIGRTVAMAIAETNEPKGAAYNAEIGKWYEANGFADMDKSLRSHLLYCKQHEVLVAQLRDNGGTVKAMAASHPQRMATLIRSHLKSQEQGDDAEPKAKKLSPKDQQIAELEAELEEASPRRAVQKMADDVDGIVGLLRPLPPEVLRQVIAQLQAVVGDAEAFDEPAPKAKARKRKQPKVEEDRPEPGSQQWAETRGDDLGESPDY